MNILYITTVSGTMDFFIDQITDLIQKGNHVDLACNIDVGPVNSVYNTLECQIYNLACSRHLSVKEIKKTITQIKRIVKNNQYDIVHCHTPIAAACTRIACKKLPVKVIYTAHGFHFYKGAPLKNWLIYYPIERFCAKWTDVLCTINSEDFALASEKMQAGEVIYVPGVGIDLNLFSISEERRTRKRQEVNIPEDAKVILTVGNLNANKNQSLIIEAMSKMKRDNLYLLIAGVGDLKEELEQLAKSYDLSDRVKLLGYRTDIGELYSTADVVCHPSKREGLSVTIMESMACGLPVICSDIRGNRDLIVNGKGGYLCKSNDVNAFQAALDKVLFEKEENNMGEYNRNRIQKFSKDEVIPQIERVYMELK